MKRTNKRKFKKNNRKKFKLYRFYVIKCFDLEVFEYIVANIEEQHFIKNYVKIRKPKYERVFAITTYVIYCNGLQSNFIVQDFVEKTPKFRKHFSKVAKVDIYNKQHFDSIKLDGWITNKD